MRILVTGATGKVGQACIAEILKSLNFENASIVALCHNRTLQPTDRIEVIKGSIADQKTVTAALKGITHVIHLATCKETPESVMDVTVKGLFLLLEECRRSTIFKHFILVGGDASMGHFFYNHSIPVTETQKHSAYPGCYALSKVLEEVMLEQYQIQYNFPGTCLRAPWIMEKDDFKFSLSFGKDVFGGPVWRELVDENEADQYQKNGTIPLMLDSEEIPIKRNFVHVDDLVRAILCAILKSNSAKGHTFNICMDEPVDYGKVSKYLKKTRNIESVPVKTKYCSTWLDNSKAKFLLGWNPKVDLHELIDRAWDYKRQEDDVRKIWYPG
ncbi:MAG: NAD(P)-dependent oxidoreductase [Verrucomicrobiota bacterium]|nr:NAD(P)-dependent oxidoreductase [Verrucomicrobiota bacterium]